MSPNLDWLISVDDHILEPAHLWQDRVATKDKEQAQRLVRDGDHEYWLYEGKKMPSSGLSAVAGKTKEEFSPNPITYGEMRPGCYDSKARVADMDRAGILASLCFPTVTRFCGQLFMEGSDRELGLRLLQAYNDWIVEEWCGAAPGRYIPLMLIPMWDPPAAVKEMERMAARGVTTFAFSEEPSKLGLPSICDKDRYWDPVFAAANELELVASMHIGSSSNVPKIADDAPFLANLAWGGIRPAAAMLSWIFSGNFQRFPNLKIALSEGDIGWIPYFLERAAQCVDKQRHWVTKGAQFMDYANSDVDLMDFDVHAEFRKHVFGCFIADDHGIASLGTIGEDNVMVETDYPHSDSTWPDSISTARKAISGLTPEQQHKLLRGNAERLYRFTPAEPPALVTA